MKTKKRILLVLLGLFASNMMLLAQVKKTVTGTVKDANGVPLLGAAITEKGSINKVISNQNGDFTIKVAPNATLVISFIGYTAKEVSVTDNLDKITLEASNESSLHEVVVTGFGQKKDKRKLAYATQEVKGEDLARANSPNLVNALQGKVAGVMINQGAGGPTSASRIRIRGNTSIANLNGNPIYVIDGVIIKPDATGASSWGSGQDFGNAVNFLNADDYESLTVLKGAAATTLYGSEAANGVILITTKKGGTRKGLGVTFNHTTTTEKAYRALDVQNEYGGGIDPTFTQSGGVDVVDPNNYFWSFGPKFDGRMVRDVDGRMIPWKANNDLLAVYQTGVYSNTNVAVEGGNDKTTFRFSYTNNGNKSILPNNKLTRNIFALRATQKISSFTNIDVSINYAVNKGLNPIRQGGNDNPLFSLVYFNPRHLDINYWKNNYDDPINGGRIDGARDFYGLGGIYYSINHNNTENKSSNLKANLDITNTITPWLTFLVRANLNADQSDFETKNWGTGPNFTGGFYQISTSNSKSIRIQSILSANRKIGNNIDLSFNVGGETNRSLGGFRFSNWTNGFKLPLKFYLANTVDPLGTDAGLIPRTRTDAVYAYGDITYKNMLTVNFSARNDWNSSLAYPAGIGTEKLTYFYPAVGASWIFSELLKDNRKFDFLSFGKLRATYAYAGRGAGDAYRTSAGNYAPFNPYTDVGGTVPLSGFSGNVIGNLALKNELSKELEIGFDVKFLKNRVGIDFAYYKKNTYNQIVDLSTPTESGVNGAVINAGNIENQGFEIQLNAIPIKNKNFEWSSLINFTKNYNKIVDLAPGVTAKTLDLAFGADVQSVAKVGGEFGLIQTGYAYAYYQKKDAAGNPVAHPSNGQKMIKTNAAYWRSQDIGQGSKELGSYLERFLLSTVNTLRYKNFTLGFQIDSKIGGLMASATHQYGSTNGSLKSTLFGRDASTGGIEFIDAAGVKRNDGIIPEGVFADGTLLKDPVSGNNIDAGGMSYAEAVQKNLIKPIDARRYYARLTQWGTGIREYSIFENTWVTLREVSIGYNFPKKVSDKLKLNNLRVLLVGRNLMYLYNSAPDNINPEGLFSNRGGSFAEYGGLPYVRSVGVTINAAF